MMNDTVLAHIAGAISQKENLATEALAFIANKSLAARAAIEKEIQHLTDVASQILHVTTQVAVGNESRPDLVLYGEEGQIQGFIEAKFWAALTDAQPVDYLKRLTEIGGGVLLMLAPEQRLRTLRVEVMERCRLAGISFDALDNGTLRADANHIAFVSWQRILDAISISAADDSSLISDVKQLSGLCQRFEAEGFLPLTREDLDNVAIPRTVMSLANLVNDVVEAGVVAEVLNTKRLNATHYIDGSGRYARFHCSGCWIGLSHTMWARKGLSPLWVRMSKSTWGKANEVRHVFRPWATAAPQRAFLDEKDGDIYLPLFLRVGVEKELVVKDAVRQLQEIDQLMRAAGVAQMHDFPPAKS